MSKHGDSKFIPDGEELKDELSRPQTVSLSRLRQESKNKSEAETASDQSLGEALFPPPRNNITKDQCPKQTANEIENSAGAGQPTHGVQNSCSNGDHEPEGNQSKPGNGKPSQRPKTVTIKSSNERKQRLVDMGAVSSQDSAVVVSDAADVNPELRITRSLSPKPKTEKCYICGKEFLLSSLKIHEKQCAKKFPKKNENQKIKETRSGKVTSDVDTSESRLHHAKNSPEAGSSVSKIPRKLEMEACYLCGREFFVHSLGIHETQCIKNWKANQRPEASQKCTSEKAKAERFGDRDENMFLGTEQQECVTEEQRKTPEKQRSSEAKESPKRVKKMGEETTSVTRQKVLKTTPCYLCGMQLLPSSLKVHEKKCRDRKEAEDEGVENTLKGSTEPAAKNGLLSNIFVDAKSEAPESGLAEKQQNESRNESLSETAKEIENPSVSNYPARTSKKPRTVICYICGQEFLKSSLAVHEKQCAGKNKTKTERGESREARDRKAVFRATPLGRKSEPSADLQREGTPTRKPKTQKCFICGKEILLSSLKIHEQQCQRKSEILKNINQQKVAQKSQQKSTRQSGTKPKTEVCYICGETFLTSSIKVHEAQCEKKWNASNRT